MKTPEKILRSIIFKIKKRVDKPDPAKPFAVLSGERAFNETFYAGAYGRLCDAFEEIELQLSRGSAIEDLDI